MRRDERSIVLNPNHIKVSDNSRTFLEQILPEPRAKIAGTSPKGGHLPRRLPARALKRKLTDVV